MLGTGQGFYPTAGGFSRVDSVQISRTISPYPCLRLELDTEVVIKVNYSVENTRVCVRYNSDPADTNCWLGEDHLTCVTAYTPTVATYPGVTIVQRRYTTNPEPVPRRCRFGDPFRRDNG